MLWYYTEGLPYSLSGIGKLIYKDANSNTKASLAHKEQRFIVSRRMRSAILRVMNLHLVSPAVTVRHLVDVALTDGKAVVILICRNESARNVLNACRENDQ